VLFVGSILNRRHVVDLIRAFGRLARLYPDVRLDIVTAQIIGAAFPIQMGSARPVIAERISIQVRITGALAVQVLPRPVLRIQAGAAQAAWLQTDGTVSEDRRAREDSNPPTE